MIRFIFSWFFVRNWHTGKHELSRPRIALVAAALFLFLLSATLIAIITAPIEYVA